MCNVHLFVFESKWLVPANYRVFDVNPILLIDDMVNDIDGLSIYKVTRVRGKVNLKHVQGAWIEHQVENS